MPTPASARPWLHVSLTAGLGAGLLGALALLSGYHLRAPSPAARHLGGERRVTVGASALSGAVLAASMAGGIVFARRRSSRRSHEILGASAGGVIGGILPALIAVVGYGSLSAPYIGTDVAAVSVVVTALALGTLLAWPASTGRAREVSKPFALGCSLLATTLVIIPFGLGTAGLAVSLLPLAELRGILAELRGILGGVEGAHESAWLAEILLSLGIALSFGAVIGAFIGLACDVAEVLAPRSPVDHRLRPSVVSGAPRGRGAELGPVLRDRLGDRGRRRRGSLRGDHHVEDRHQHQPKEGPWPRRRSRTATPIAFWAPAPAAPRERQREDAEAEGEEAHDHGARRRPRSRPS
ncbi:MAG: hypothetical protein R3B09_17415 [Nannocystaceae bacterium]